MKALVESLHGVQRGHSITGILQQLSSLVEIPEAVFESARELDQVYITARYPNGFPSGAPGDYFSEHTSQRLIGHARTILEFCRSKVH